MTASGPILVLAALKAELAPLRARLDDGDGLRFGLTGMGLRRAEAAARRLVPGSDLVVSAGCCGALREDAAPGLLVIPRRVLGEAGPAPAPDPGWVEAALSAARRLELAADEGPLLSVAAPLLDGEAKRASAARSGARAVDMETAAVAAVAAELGRPYLCARVVLDTVDEALPGAASGQALAMKDLLERLARVADDLGRCLAELLRTERPR